LLHYLQLSLVKKPGVDAKLQSKNYVMGDKLLLQHLLTSQSGFFAPELPIILPDSAYSPFFELVGKNIVSPDDTIYRNMGAWHLELFPS
jgi:hypothetical protein